MIGMCQKHCAGISFGGNFTSSQILFHEGQVKFDGSIVPVQYSQASAKLDYDQLHTIFSADFCDNSSKSYPLHVQNLLDFLWAVPDGANPDSEDVVAFLTNHPAVISYMQRISVCQLLDNLFSRLSNVDHKTIYMFLGNLGGPRGWINLVRNVRAMDTVYTYGCTFDQKGNPTPPPYGANRAQCLHFSNNFFKHAGPHLKMEEIRGGIFSGYGIQ